MQSLIAPLERFFLRWLPDAFTIAIVLSLVTFALAISLTDYTLGETVASWGDGFWNLLTFTGQITLTLLLGYAIANTPPVRKALAKFATLIRTPLAAYASACLVTGLCALFSWGLSMVVAGILPRYIGQSCQRRGIKIHYPLLVAASFSGFVVWHQGLSASISLAIATPGHFLEDRIGIIPTSETLFTSWNLIIIAVVLITLPFAMAAMQPKNGEPVKEIATHQVPDEKPGPVSEEPLTPADNLENSKIVLYAIIIFGIAYIWIHFFQRGNGLTLNTFNFCFLIVGLIVAGSLKNFVENILECGRIAMPFIIQYPFYAGIAGVTQDSGLANLVIDGFVSISSPESLPLLGFFSAGLLNMFIPSGGGQWAVQGPIMMGAAMEIGADLPRVAMGVSLGDQWTNLIHPLALLPATTIAGIKTKEVMGYCFMGLIFTGIIFILALIPW